MAGGRLADLQWPRLGPLEEWGCSTCPFLQDTSPGCSHSRGRVARAEGKSIRHFSTLYTCPLRSPYTRVTCTHILLAELGGRETDSVSSGTGTAQGHRCDPLSPSSSQFPPWPISGGRVSQPSQGLGDLSTSHRGFPLLHLYHTSLVRARHPLCPRGDEWLGFPYLPRGSPHLLVLCVTGCLRTAAHPGAE